MLSDSQLKALKPKDKEYLINDKPNLYIKILPSGVKVFLFIKMEHGKRRKYSLGKYPAISLAEARKRCDKLLLDTNPNEITLSRLISEYKAIKANLSASREYMLRHLERYLLDLFGDAPLYALTPPAVLSVIKSHYAVTSSVAHELCLALARLEVYAFNCGYTDSLRFQNLTKALAPHTVTHIPAPHYSELKSMLASLRLKPRNNVSLALLFGLLSGLRGVEVERLQWSYIKDDVIIFPATDMKARRAFTLPLTPALKAILDQLPRKSSKVFSCSHSGVSARCRSVGYCRHGFRSMLRSFLSDNNIRFDVAEMCLAHAVGDATVQTYNRTELIEERRKALTIWNDYVLACLPDHIKIL